jgi:formamidopyrimidine-DNA glycosylase
VPELPEVEVLVRHLRPVLIKRSIVSVQVRRARVIRPTTPRHLGQVLRRARFVGLRRRGKYLVFELHSQSGKPITLVGHLGMTGRMYLLPYEAPLPKHAAIVMDLNRERFVFEDTRYFGRLTLDDAALQKLGMEPLDPEFTPEKFALGLRRSAQPIKVKLLNQALVAGIGNIYASESLFRAGISPRKRAGALKPRQVERLWHSIREVLNEAIERGSTIPLAYDGSGTNDGLFYFGLAPDTQDDYEERFRVYDRAGQPCFKCGNRIRRLVQAARSTYFCPVCQSSREKQSHEATAHRTSRHR